MSRPPAFAVAVVRCGGKGRRCRREVGWVEFANLPSGGRVLVLHRSRSFESDSVRENPRPVRVYLLDDDDSSGSLALCGAGHRGVILHADLRAAARAGLTARAAVVLTHETGLSGLDMTKPRTNSEPQVRSGHYPSTLAEIVEGMSVDDALWPYSGGNEVEGPAL